MILSIACVVFAIHADFDPFATAISVGGISIGNWLIVDHTQQNRSLAARQKVFGVAMALVFGTALLLFLILFAIVVSMPKIGG